MVYDGQDDGRDQRHLALDRSRRPSRRARPTDTIRSRRVRQFLIGNGRRSPECRGPWICCTGQTPRIDLQRAPKEPAMTPTATLTRPAIDLDVPAQLQTATFALG